MSCFYETGTEVLSGGPQDWLILDVLGSRMRRSRQRRYSTRFSGAAVLTSVRDGHLSSEPASIVCRGTRTCGVFAEARLPQSLRRS